MLGRFKLVAPKWIEATTPAWKDPSKGFLGGYVGNHRAACEGGLRDRCRESLRLGVDAWLGASGLAGTSDFSPHSSPKAKGPHQGPA